MSEVALNFSNLFVIYKDGHVDRLFGTQIVPPSMDDPNSDVQSKDVTYSQEPNLSSRIFLPKGTKPHQKLPLLVYFHGGAFVIESAFSAMYHKYLSQLAQEANVLVVSIDYRLAPEHLLPAAFEDSWAALKWVASHSGGLGPEEWLNSHADFVKVYLGGDSSGGTIAYNMAMRHGRGDKLAGKFDLSGVVFLHPFFWGEHPIGAEDDRSLKRFLGDKEGRDKLWELVYPSSSGCDDPIINPGYEPDLAMLGCSKVLIAVAEKDLLRDRGWYFYETLKNSGWQGEAEIMEAEGEDHVFHLFNPDCQNAKALQQKVAGFINQGMPYNGCI